MNRSELSRDGSRWRVVGFGAILFTVIFSPYMHAQEGDSADRVRKAVVELLAVGPGQNGQNRECEATGFIVNAQGYILTNAHVVEEAQECLKGSTGTRILAKHLTAHPSIGRAVSCDLVSLDDIHDLALLKAERPLFDTSDSNEKTFVELSRVEVEEGAELAVTGHPEFAWRPLTRSGRLVQHGTLNLSDQNSISSEVLILDIPLRKGNSGSPVYRPENGGVVAVVERKDLQRPSRTVAVPILYAIKLLERAGVAWHMALD
jgi:serine protease Do